jgi:predicted AAA+ superfamily ATPase
MTTKTALKYYDFKYVLSHNAVYNFVVGARGLGKTYGAKKMVIRNYLR